MEGISRRNFVRTAIMGGAGLALAGVATGCSTQSAASTASADEAGAGAAYDCAADLIIIGGGAAGMMAAAAAYDENKATSIVIEKSPMIGGDSKFAVGVQACWPERRAADGGASDDSPEKYLADWRNGFPRSIKGMRGDAEITEHPFGERFAQISASACNFMYNTIGIDLLPYGEEGSDPEAQGWLTTFAQGEELEPCANAPIGRCWWNGTEPFTTTIQKYCQSSDCYKELVNCEAYQLIQDTNGRVVGVEFFDANGILRRAKANKAVVLASGSYCSNHDMIARYNGVRYADFHTGGHLYNTGDGHRMAQRIGAGLTDMNLGFIIQGTPDGTSDLLLFDHYLGYFHAREGALAPYLPGIAVNQKAQRVVDEARGKFDMMLAFAEEPQGIGFYISDAQFPTDHFASCSMVYQADTIEEMAGHLNLDPVALKATVDQYNSYVDAGEDPDWKKPMANMPKIEKAPFWALRVLPKPFVSLGGVATDVDSHVLDASNAVIPGLYAAGIVCGSYWEQEGLPYTGGFNQALIFGDQAGRIASSEEGEGEFFAEIDTEATTGPMAAKSAHDATAEVGPLNDGTYSGTAKGMGGDINVAIEVKDGKISVSDISPNNETVGIGGYEAIEDGTYKAMIEEAQSADIDVITGATITSNAIADATREALEQAAK